MPTVSCMWAQRIRGTGKEQKIRIEAGSGLSKEEIEKGRTKRKPNEESDKKEKEKVEKINQADSPIFQSEKQLKEYGEKISADKNQRSNQPSIHWKMLTKPRPRPHWCCRGSIECRPTSASEEMYKATQDAGRKSGADARPAKRRNRTGRQVPKCYPMLSLKQISKLWY